VDDHGIVLLGQGADLGWKAAAVAIGAGHGAEADGLKGLLLEPGGTRWVKTGHRSGHAQGCQVRGDLAYTFNRAAAAWVEGADQTEEFQNGKALNM
jgi:hypothetical protein